jgi:hypothetical protein
MTSDLLAETIAAVDKVLSFVETCGDDVTAPIKVPYVRLLLACARRCEAMDNAGGTTWRDLLNSWGVAPTGRIHLEVQALLDAAAERDALAKRVGELEELLGVEESGLTRAELLAEADRLMAELDEAESELLATTASAKGLEKALHRFQHGQETEGDYACAPSLRQQAIIDELRLEASALREVTRNYSVALTAAEDRVRELEAENQRFRERLPVLTPSEMDRRRDEVLAYDFTTSNKPGPITAPTQGVAPLTPPEGK